MTWKFPVSLQPHGPHLPAGSKGGGLPRTKRIEEWPSWGIPIFRWAKAQGAVTGFAHSGWGLAVKQEKLPTDEMPPFDGIGANEYIVGVTHELVDFISTVDTPYAWELNIWYHTLNAGYRARISGETDFPASTATASAWAAAMCARAPNSITATGLTGSGKAATTCRTARATCSISRSTMRDGGRRE